MITIRCYNKNGRNDTMMRFGKPLPPLNAKVEYIGTAHSISSKEFKEEYEKADDIMLCKKCGEQFTISENTTTEYCSNCINSNHDSYSDLIECIPIINENTHSCDLKSAYMED